MDTTREIQLTVDCSDPQALAGFWSKALGYDYDAPPGGFETWEAALDHFGVPEAERNNVSACSPRNGSGPRLFFQRVPETKSVKNRLHLDVRAAPGLGGDARMEALEHECERLVSIGAHRLRRCEPEPPMSAGFIVMADPEGNEFCLD